MQLKSLAAALTTAAFLSFGSAATASPIIIMDEDTNNGSFSVNAGTGLAPNRGSWSASDNNRPLGWMQTNTANASFPWTQNGGASTATILGFNTSVAVNNTEVLVGDGLIYTVTANANTTNATQSVTVEVLATENIDGTGASVQLAAATLAGGTAPSNPFDPNENPPLFAIADTGLASTSAIEDYYVQVQISGSGPNAYFYVDDIVVTAVAIPEPASAMLFGLAAVPVLIRRRRRAA